MSLTKDVGYVRTPPPFPKIPQTILTDKAAKL